MDIIDLHRAMIEGFARLETLIGTGAKQSAKPAGAVADDADLDGKFGDEEIRKMPSDKYWSGASFVGKRLSQTPPDFLDAFAKYKDACAYMNEKSGDAEKAKYIGYDRKSASRARGWAARVRAGKVTQVQTTMGADDFGPPPDDDSIPF